MIQAFKTLLLVMLALNPEFDISWMKKGDNPVLKASLIGYETELKQCLSSGLSLRFRYEFEVCRKRKFWADDCKASRLATSAVEFDPISETYVVTSDLLKDSEPPQVERVTDIPRALAMASNRSDITWSWLSDSSGPPFDDPRQVFRGRVLAECRGEYSESMKRLSYILSFGIVRSAGYDSGWVEFKR